MARQTQLVSQHLENISHEALSKYQDVIRSYVREREKWGQAGFSTVTKRERTSSGPKMRASKNPSATETVQAVQYGQTV